jgi:hypothetical protein
MHASERTQTSNSLAELKSQLSKASQKKSQLGILTEAKQNRQLDISK